MNWIGTVTICMQLLAIGIIVLLWRNYLATYLGEKGKNLATKEDIAAITKKIESVKALYAYDAEKSKNQATKEDIATITREVESVKAVYTGEVESLRAALGSRSHIHQTR